MEGDIWGKSYFPCSERVHCWFSYEGGWLTRCHRLRSNDSVWGRPKAFTEEAIAKHNSDPKNGPHINPEDCIRCKDCEKHEFNPNSSSIQPKRKKRVFRR